VDSVRSIIAVLQIIRLPKQYGGVMITSPSIGCEVFVPRRQDLPMRSDPVIRSAVYLLVT
jgi:hypothetical protein